MTGMINSGRKFFGRIVSDETHGGLDLFEIDRIDEIGLVEDHDLRRSDLPTHHVQVCFGVYGKAARIDNAQDDVQLRWQTISAWAQHR